MNETHIRKQLLIQNMNYGADRSNLLKQAAEAETYEEKDIAYRKAAVAGLRIDSVLKAIKEVNEATGDLGRQRAFQRHMRDMKRLKYTDRPAFATSDGLDMEVMSQFFQSDDPEQNQKYQELMTGVKLKAGAPIPKGSGLVVEKKGAYSENEDSTYKVPVFVKESETPEPTEEKTDSSDDAWTNKPLRNLPDLEPSPMLAAATTVLNGEIDPEEQFVNSSIIAKKLIESGPMKVDEEGVKPFGGFKQGETQVYHYFKGLHGYSLNFSQKEGSDLGLTFNNNPRLSISEALDPLSKLSTASKPAVAVSEQNDAHKGLLGDIRKLMNENPMPPVIVIDSYQPSLADATISIQKDKQPDGTTVSIERTKLRDVK